MPETLRNNEGDAEITGNQAIANCMNNFYVNVGPRIAAQLQTRDQNQLDSNSFINRTHNTSMFFQPVIQQEIRDILRNLRNSASGIDNFKPQVIKYIRESIALPLTQIVEHNYRIRNCLD